MPRNSPNNAVDLLLMALCLSLGPASAANVPESPESEVEADALDQSGPASDQKPPVPIKPSKEPSARGLQLALLVGIDIPGWAGYSYDTRVNLPDGQQLRYRGTAGAPGVMLSLGGAVTLRGALRRITLGASIKGGGLSSSRRPVIPAGVLTPFSQTNLQNQIFNKYSYAPGWSPARSLYIDHDLGFLHQSRVRAGYQYWRQTGSYTGVFEPTDRSRPLADYQVRLESRSHLIRVSVNDYGAVQDPDSNTSTSHRSRRKFGILRQLGVSIGTHRTIVVFAGIGPFWEVAR